MLHKEVSLNKINRQAMIAEQSSWLFRFFMKKITAIQRHISRANLISANIGNNHKSLISTQNQAFSV